LRPCRDLISSEDGLVLTFTNVLEFVVPLLGNGDFLHFRPLLQRLERMPILFLRDAHIPMQELKHATHAFLSDSEYSEANPYVRRWEESAQLPGVSVCQDLLGLRIDEAVWMIWKTNPQAIKGPGKDIETLRSIMAKDRRLVQSDRVRAVENFPNAIRRSLERSNLYGFDFPLDRTEELANWIYSDPRRCPGMRLHYELYHQKLSNTLDLAKAGDLSDHSLASCLPYVDVISVDKRTAHYLKPICTQLERKIPEMAYLPRVYTGLQAIVQSL
jgi:hypothetical protein